MSNSKKVLKLRQDVLKANTQLEQIKNSGILESSIEANTRYNQILIQKAILKKEIDITQSSFMKKFFNRLFNHSKNERLICDYFKS